ncbi:hypothetical protein COHA_010328 [Chlorella ohadii]|uniref:Chromo domain-containing protein n=1 Tax=Chlorella ohadii TaxID=2649997 RepID=A0AAD5H0N4_9CHLO|nr:hypothetical protein COHA_010328 [Chlorella ohadii]
MASQPSQMELERQKRIAENMRRMAEIGLNQAVEELQARRCCCAALNTRLCCPRLPPYGWFCTASSGIASQQVGQQAAPKKHTVIERVLVREEDLRRSSRDKKQVSYNEHTFFKAADAALEEARPKRKFLVVQKSRTVTTGGGGRAVRCSGWSPCMGSAGFAAMERCQEAAEECAQGLTNTAFVKSLSQSMVSGGFWCNAPRGMTQVVTQQLGVDYKCELMAYLPAEQTVPADACHTNLAGDGWAMVWLPRKGEFGFSGGWRSFSLDMLSTTAFMGACFGCITLTIGWRSLSMTFKLFPGDCVVVELVPRGEHRGEQGTKFTILLHVFRALDYETDGEKAAREVAQAAAAVKLEKVEEEEEERAAPAENGQSAEPMAEQSNDASEGPRPEGPPAAVDAAAAELSGEAQQGTQQAQQAAGTKRKQQTKLARTRTALAANSKQPSPAAAGSGRKATGAPKASAKAAAKGQVGSSAAAAGKKGRGGSGGKKQGAAPKQAAGKQKASGGKKQESQAAAAAAVATEESYDVERILAVRPAAGGSGKEYLIKWLGWEAEWNSWEPRAHLDRPLVEYPLAEGLTLADLE